MTLTLRRDKGSALTYAEMDENFLHVANNASLDVVLSIGNSANNDINLNGNVTADGVYASVAEIQSLTANTISAGSIVAPGGMVLQTVYRRVDTKSTWSFTTATTPGTRITDLDTTITPRFSNSRILINFSITYEVHWDTVFKLFRIVSGVPTEIGTNTTDSNYWSGIWVNSYDNNNDSTARTESFFFIDEPNTLLPVTYSLMIQSAGVGASFLSLNRTIASLGQASYEVGISQVILQELTA